MINEPRPLFFPPINIWLTPDGQRQLLTILQLLAPFPEAKAALATFFSGRALPAPGAGPA
jgi:hypothetical protein